MVSLANDDNYCSTDGEFIRLRSVRQTAHEYALQNPVMRQAPCARFNRHPTAEHYFKYTYLINYNCSL